MPTKQRYCCICSNHAQKWDGDRKIKLHRFPANSRAKKVWMSRCRLVRKDFKFTSSDSTRLCSDHFVGKNGPTPEHPLPSIFPNKTFKLSYFDANIPENELEGLEEPSVSPDSGASDTSSDGDAPGVKFDSSKSRLDCSLQFNDYCGVVYQSSIFRNQNTQTYPETVSSGTQTEDITLPPIPDKPKFTSTASQTETEEKQVHSVGIQVDRPVLTYEDIKKDMRILKSSLDFPKICSPEHTT